MSLDESRDQMTQAVTTRRKIVTTGAKIAYGAPIVAASFKLSSMGASATSKKECCKGTYSNPKVAICHKDDHKKGPHLICVDEHAAKAHIKHGDKVIATVPKRQELCWEDPCGETVSYSTH